MSAATGGAWHGEPLHRAPSSFDAACTPAPHNAMSSSRWFGGAHAARPESHTMGRNPRTTRDGRGFLELLAAVEQSLFGAGRSSRSSRSGIAVPDAAPCRTSRTVAVASRSVGAGTHACRDADPHGRHRSGSPSCSRRVRASCVAFSWVLLERSLPQRTIALGSDTLESRPATMTALADPSEVVVRVRPVLVDVIYLDRALVAADRADRVALEDAASDRRPTTWQRTATRATLRPGHGRSGCRRSGKWSLTSDPPPKMTRPGAVTASGRSTPARRSVLCELHDCNYLAALVRI